MEAMRPGHDHASAAELAVPPAAVAARARPLDTSSNRLRASLVDLTFIIWAVAIPIAFPWRLLNSDGDLSRHMAMGEHMLRNGFIRTDLFSFTKAGEPFVAYEWLSQLVYALLHDFGGIAAVAICAAMIIAAAYALVVRFMLRRGVDPMLAYLVGIAAAVLGAVHWLARPHLFTFVALALLLEIMEGEGRRRLWLAAPLFLVWANLHPGFVIGLILLGVYAAGEIVEGLASGDRAKWFGRARDHGVAAGIGLIATFLTPNHFHLLPHIQSLLGNQFLMNVTSEFMSPNFHAVHGKLFLAALLGILTVLTLRAERLPFHRLFLLLVLLGAALISQRNITIFGLVVLPVLALELDSSWRRLSLRKAERVRAVFRDGEAIALRGRWLAPIAAALLLLAANRGSIGGVSVVTNSLDEKTFPIAAVEHAKQAGVTGRIFHELIWGGYLLHAWPGQKIFIDGLTDHFGEEHTRTYLDILVLEPGWDRKLDEFEISVALLPTKSALAYALAREDTWQKLFEDSTAVLLQRPRRVP